jgi:hypothetical protein
MSIFISIASYRDTELIPTIDDCLSKAKDPDNLFFGICWQHGEEEQLPDAIKRDSRFRILDIDWRESRGVCWARSEIMKSWNHEDHYLQIDSHHRFASHWDTKLIEFAALTSSRKPVLTTYCPSYSPEKNCPVDTPATVMEFDYFTPDGIIMCKPGYLKAGGRILAPLPARFLSAHFLFAPGSFVREVPYNPRLYFHGEEITLAIRAYSWGYDLFHPHKPLLWHEYTRKHRRKHWDDHLGGASIELPWADRDRQSREIVCQFLKKADANEFGCGPARSLEQYCEFAGIDLAAQTVLGEWWRDKVRD